MKDCETLARLPAKAVSPGLKAASEAEVRAAIDAADPLVLRGLLYFLTQDVSLIAIASQSSPGLTGVDVPVISNPDDVTMVRAKTVDFLLALRDGKAKLPEAVPHYQVRQAMSLAICNRLPPEQLEFWLEELALTPTERSPQWEQAPDKKDLEDFSVILIGAGLGGLNAAIQLKLAGFDFTVFEKNPGVGGVWYQNRYPGARVDLPSRAYSHGFAVDYPFTVTFASQGEMEKYVNWYVDEYDIRSHIQCETEVLAAHWDEDASMWNVRIRDSEGKERVHRANAIISAVGFLDRPVKPQFEGLERFKGRTFHTTELTDDLDLQGLRVAVIGTGSTGMQMVPIIADQLKELTIFQRSPAWTIPVAGYRDDLSPEAVWLDANVPFYTNWTRFTGLWMTAGPGFWSLFDVDPNWKDPYTTSQANFNAREKFVEYIEYKLKDRPDLLEKCLPKYPPFAKRYVLDNGWFDTLLRPNVELVTDTIDHFTEEAIVTADGQSHAVDVVIFAIGFRANDYFWPIEIIGRDNKTFAELWAEDGARAYLGMTFPHFPNFFAIYGPNTNPRVNGPVFWGEMQTRYALECMGAMIQNGWDAIEVREDAYDRYNAELDHELSSTVWLDPRQKSYYRNEFGRCATNAPWGGYEYWRRIRTPHLEHYLHSQSVQASPGAHS